MMLKMQERPRRGDEEDLQWFMVVIRMIII